MKAAQRLLFAYSVACPAIALLAQAVHLHTLYLLWGSKNDKRSALITINGRPHQIARGGYDGFEWVTIPIEAAQVPQEVVTLTIVPDPPNGKAAFISEAKLTTP